MTKDERRIHEGKKSVALCLRAQADRFPLVVAASAYERVWRAMVDWAEERPATPIPPNLWEMAGERIERELAREVN